MSPPADPAFVALQAAVAGRFSLEGELGRGGMGIVFLARDVILERPVAIKLLAPALAARSDMRRRFLREARIAAGCFHPHIVPIHAVEESGDLAWLVMSYVRGETLADRIRRAGALPHDTVRRIGQEIGLALACLHERGIVHRDVKPENILMEDGTDRALITDFGIALPGIALPGIAVHDDVHTTPARGEVAGTMRYMAPEQALGERLDGRADLYALGVTLFVAATGRHPFEGANPMAILAATATSTAPNARAVAPALPESLGDAIDRCLARDPSQRFRDAAEFVAALTPVRVPAPLPSALVPTSSGMGAARALAFWGGVVALTGIPFMIGEHFSGSLFDSAILGAVLQATCIILGLAATVRATEALLAARAALRQGASARDAMRSLVADGSASAMSRRNERRASSKWLGVCVGAALAVVQGPVSGMSGLPSFIDSSLQLALLFAPPLLVGRNVAALWRGSRAERWLTTRVSHPLSARIVRWLSRGRGEVRHAQPLPAAAATEVRLGAAAQEIVARLPEQLRASVAGAPAAAAALAAEAERLRQRDLELSGQQRVLRRREGAPDAVELSRLGEERARLQGRLGATIAALEALRLDLLRLEAGSSAPGELTAHLEVVRDVQHHVDAVRDVRRLLSPQVQHEFEHEPTPV